MDEIKGQLREIILNLYGVEILPEVSVAPEGQKDASGRKIDYATNVAMRLAGQLKRKPKEIAEEIKEKFLSDETDERGKNGHSGDFDVEVAGPGFLNFISSDEYFKRKLGELSEHFEENIACDEYEDKMVVSEFSDPNPFKVLHVGHLYTSIMGEAISRLIEFAGGEVRRANFGGDVGLHVAKTLYALLLRLNRFSSGRVADARLYGVGALGLTSKLRTPSEKDSTATVNDDKIFTNTTGLSETEHLFGFFKNDVFTTESSMSPAEVAGVLAECYVEGTKAYEDDEEAHREIVALNKIIYEIAEEGHPRRRGPRARLHGARPLWLRFAHASQGANGSDLRNAPSDDLLDTISTLYWWGREASYRYFEEFYSSIGLKFDKYYPESTVAQRGLSVVKEQLKNGVYEDSDGAVVFRGEPYGLHTRVFINKEGLPTYEAKDVGLIHTKWDDYHFDKSIVITGNDIIEYMKVVLKSVEQYNPELVERTKHVTHGNVKLAGGVKMSSRKGNFLKAADVLEMVRGALGEEQGEKPVLGDGETQDEKGVSWTEDNEKIALGATKYAFLKYKIGGDIVFDPEESVKMAGNSGPYLQYACVRAKKILSSLGNLTDDKDLMRLSDDKWELCEQERDLVRKVLEYKEVLREAVGELAPHKICGYLYELAQVFNRFYENVKVRGSEFEAERATIASVYLSVLTHGLDLLGIEIPEAM